MGPNFANCASEFLNYSTTRYPDYIFRGTVPGMSVQNEPTLITLEGCKKLCGDGVDYYAWYLVSTEAAASGTTDTCCRKDAANTITTWVLPIIGLLVQAPFESNKAWETILSLCRYQHISQG